MNDFAVKFVHSRGHLGLEGNATFNLALPGVYSSLSGIPFCKLQYSEPVGDGACTVTILLERICGTSYAKGRIITGGPWSERDQNPYVDIQSLVCDVGDVSPMKIRPAIFALFLHPCSD